MPGLPALGVILAVLLSLAQVSPTIPYTVQVITASDQSTALSLQTELRLEGFPAYVVRASTGQGDLYRVRVGAFANRDAALSYAGRMPPLGGSQPVPILAESIPQRTTPLATRLLAELPLEEGDRIAVYSWGDSLALKGVPPGAPSLARYVIIGEGGVAEFSAFEAVPTKAGEVLAVKPLTLWPANWQEASAEAREMHRASLIRFVASNLDLPQSTVMDSQVTGDETPPYLVVLERFVPGEDAPGTVLAIGQRVEAADPPLIVLLDGEGVLEGLAAPDPLFEASNSEPSTPSEVLGNGWRAMADDGFLRLEVLNGSQTWRAAIGSPLWSDGRHLVTREGRRVLLYDFLPR